MLAERSPKPNFWSGAAGLIVDHILLIENIFPLFRLAKVRHTVHNRRLSSVAVSSNLHLKFEKSNLLT
jgi:hypothetical protein